MISKKIYRDYGSVDVSYIEKFEKEKNCRFPLEYKKLITKHNAVWLEKRDFHFQHDDMMDSRDVIFFGYGDDLKKSLKIELSQQEEYSHDGIIVIGESANGDFICFDYGTDLTTDNPSVVLMLHDYLDKYNKMPTYPVAGSFEKFISLLYKNDDDDE